MKLRKALSVLLVLLLLLSGSSLFASAAVYSLGDVNGDGKITSADARVVLRCAARLEPLSSAQTQAADADRSGKVNSSDARLLLRVASKMETLEVGEDDVFTQPEPMTELTAVSGELSPYFAAAIGGDRVAYFCEPFPEQEPTDPDAPESDGGEIPAVERYVYLLDTAADEITAEYTIPPEEFFFCMRENGELITADYDMLVLRFYDEGGALLRSMDIPDTELIADPAGDCLYAIADKSVDRIGFDGEKETILTVKDGFSIAGLDTDRELALLMDLSAGGTTWRDILLYSWAEDRILFSAASDTSSFSLNGDQVVYLDSVTIPTQGLEDETVYTLNVRPIADGESESFVLPWNDYVQFFAGSDFGLMYHSVYNDDFELVQPEEYYLIDAKNGRMTGALEPLTGASWAAVEYLPDAGKIFAAAYYETEDGARSRLFLIDPAAAEFYRPLEKFNAPKTEPPVYEIPAGFEDCRTQADEIERDFHVQVLFGDECRAYEEGSGYEFVSILEPSDEPEALPPAEELSQMLTTLRRGLSMYPEGFFDTFKNARGEGGVRFMMVRALVNPGGEFLAGGVHYNFGAWYNVAIDAGNMATGADTVHHELWHAVEARIGNADSSAFGDDAWNALNPPGFEYSWDLDHYYENEALFDYIIPWDDDASKYQDVYFAEIYSTVTPFEDRATLIERLTGDYLIPEELGYPDRMSYLAAMPHLNAKLQYMADWTERVFGVVYWEYIVENMPRG